MKRISLYITIASVMTLLAGCAKEITGDTPKGDGPFIQLDLSCVAADLVTKAKDAVDEDNENIIKNLDCFLYPKGATNANAVLKQHVSVDARGNYTCYVDVTDTQINTLFPDTAAECDVFVVANWASDLTSVTDTKVSSLKALTQTADFLGSDKGLSPQSSFVMAGESKVALVNKSETICASGEISLERLAARITLGVSVSNEYVETTTDAKGNSVDITWTPVMSTLGVVFTNCASMVNLAGDPESFDEVTGFRFNYGAYTGSSFTSARTFYDTGGKDKEFSTTDAAKYTNRYECDRFYTYPAAWDKNSEDEPCFIIRLYWKYSDETGNHAVPLYYKVIIPFDDFDMNHWYDFNVRLSVLGSLSPLRPTLEMGEPLSYYVGDWEESLETGSGKGYDVDAEIRDARFIVVESNYYMMPNQNSLTIPFESSHNCVLMGETINTSTGLGKNDWSKSTMPYAVRENFYSGGYQTFQTKDFTTGGTTDFKIRIVNDVTNQVRKVELEHVLNNDTSTTGYDYAEYTLKFRIAHDGAEGKFYEDITVVQRPALYIKAEKNPEGEPSSSTKAKYTFVNKGGNLKYSNGSSAASGYDNLGFNPENGVNTGNTNPNMYIISTSVLSDGSSYIIADPRSKDVSIPSVFGTDASKSASAVPVNGGSARRLTNYYPIGTDSELNDIIAPKFRIASSWGATSDITYEYAKARCASYQEYGYPAGRWRLPTAAEIAYMCQLTTDGVIPRLLGRDKRRDNSIPYTESYTNYWCGNGYVSVANGDYTGSETLPAFRNNTSSSLHQAVRCVYDEWYWENSAYPKASDISKFTWGDLPR